MTAEDRLLMLDVLFEVRVRLAPDGEHLAVRGNPEAVECATPMLMQRKAELLKYLNTTTPNGDGK